jgi:hypothetical protein
VLYEQSRNCVGRDATLFRLQIRCAGGVVAGLVFKRENRIRQSCRHASSERYAFCTYVFGSPLTPGPACRFKAGLPAPQERPVARISETSSYDSHLNLQEMALLRRAL